MKIPLALLCLLSPAFAQSYTVHPNSEQNGTVSPDGVTFDVPITAAANVHIRARIFVCHDWGVENCGSVPTSYQGGATDVQLWQHEGIGAQEGVIAIPAVSGGYFGGPTLSAFDGQLDYSGSSAHVGFGHYPQVQSFACAGMPWTVANSPVQGMHRIKITPFGSSYMHTTTPGVPDSALSFYDRPLLFVPTVVVTFQ
jgi:hypothetical protein